MMKKLLVYAIPVASLILLIVIGVIVTSPASEPADSGIPAEPIANDDRYSDLTEDMKYYRNPDYPQGYSNAVAHLEVPQHPFMASNDRNNNMHCDAYMTTPARSPARWAPARRSFPPTSASRCAPPTSSMPRGASCPCAPTSAAPSCGCMMRRR